jgi:hypothetical protein
VLRQGTGHVLGNTRNGGRCMPARQLGSERGGRQHNATIGAVHVPATYLIRGTTLDLPMVAEVS